MRCEPLTLYHLRKSGEFGLAWCQQENQNDDNVTHFDDGTRKPV